MMTNFPALPDDSRLWVLTAERQLTGAEQASVLEWMQRFVSAWTSHGRPVQGEVALEDGRFLLVAAHIEEGANAGVSGCGIDKMIQAAEVAATHLGFAWLDGLQVVYRDHSGAVRALPRPAFREEVRQGRVTGATTVIDTTVPDLHSLRSQGLERPAAASWHGRVFRLGPPAETASS
jgi:hypothetical protein